MGSSLPNHLYSTYIHSIHIYIYLSYIHIHIYTYMYLIVFWYGIINFPILDLLIFLVQAASQRSRGIPGVPGGWKPWMSGIWSAPYGSLLVEWVEWIWLGVIWGWEWWDDFIDDFGTFWFIFAYDFVWQLLGRTLSCFCGGSTSSSSCQQRFVLDRAGKASVQWGMFWHVAPQNYEINKNYVNRYICI